MIATRFLNDTPLTDIERAAVEARFPATDFASEIQSGDTNLRDYETWLQHQIESFGYGDAPSFCLDSENAVVFRGDDVDAEPKDGDFNNAFTGTVVGFKENGQGGYYIQVRDQEDNVLDCDPDQVTLTE